MTVPTLNSQFIENSDTLSVITWPHDVLKSQCEDVVEFDNVKVLVGQMIKTMQVKKGVGLAAPQIRCSKNIIVFQNVDNYQYGYMINPQIVEYSISTQKSKEGCLSIPGYFQTIDRYKKVTVQFKDVNGKTCHYTASGINANIIQHEIDHLRGIVFIDYLSPLKQSMARKKINKLKR